MLKKVPKFLRFDCFTILCSSVSVHGVHCVNMPADSPSVTMRQVNAHCCLIKRFCGNMVNELNHPLRLLLTSSK